MKDVELEDLNIYKAYMELLFYSYQIMQKFPKNEMLGLEHDIKKMLNEGVDYMIMAQKSFDSKERLQLLNKLDCKLKSLKLYIRVSYKNKYITGHNYGAWSRKIANVGNLLGGWIKSCLKH